MFIVQKLIAAGLVAFMGLGADGGDPLKVKPIATMAGSDTKIEFPMVRLITTQPQWTELWTLHKGQPVVKSAAGDIKNADATACPVVDFDKNQVVIVFGGHLNNVQKYDYVKTLAEDGTAVIRVAENVFPTSTNYVVMTPYLMMVVPKEPVPIAVDLDSVDKQGNHFWKRLARFRLAPPKKTTN